MLIFSDLAEPAHTSRNRPHNQLVSAPQQARYIPYAHHTLMAMRTE